MYIVHFTCTVALVPGLPRDVFIFAGVEHLKLGKACMYANVTRGRQQVDAWWCGTLHVRVHCKWSCVA